MKKYNEIIISLILSIINLFFIWHNFLVNGNNIIFLFILLTSFNLIHKGLMIKNRRINCVSIIISVIFTFIEIIGKSINQDYTLDNIINKWLLVNFIGYFTIGWTVIKLIYYSLDRINIKKLKKIDIKINFLNNNYSFFITCIVLILLVWIPYLLKYYPGIVTSDSYTQIEQAIGKIPLQDHHPIAHTAIVSLCINLGLILFKNINTAIALYSLVSMLLMACFDSAVLVYLRKKSITPIILGMALLYYMFYPVNAIYSITMWKDILFSGIFPIFLIFCNELLVNTDYFFKDKRKMIIFVIVSFLMTVLRHNGLYVVLFTLPFFYIVKNQYWKKLSIVFLSIIVVCQVFNVIVFNVLKVEKGSVGEMLSVPLQQIARVEKKHRSELSVELKNRINAIFITESIGDYYNPTLSDPVKAKINIKYFKENKIECIKIWTKLLLKYPKDYVESFISNSYGYYYPEAYNGVVSRATMDHNMGIEQKPKIQGKIVERIDSFIDRRDIPLVSMIFSIGMAFWVIIICLGYKIYKEEYKIILIYLPILVLWLTCIASPVFCEYRYAYPIFTTIFIYISLNFTKQEEEIKQIGE